MKRNSTAKIERWWSRVLDFIAPRQCVVCGSRLAIGEHSICTVCNLHLPRTAFQFSPTDNPMAQLFWHHTPVERAAALFYYQSHSETARILYDLKYHDCPYVGEDLGRLMAGEMLQAGFFDGIDVLLPVPLSRWRRNQRGYNQSEWLARGIADVTGLPICTKALRRSRFVQSQTHLTREQRYENVAQTFELADAAPLRNRHVLLVDDVCTTGATLSSCADVLRGIEGVRISVLTLGFTLH